MKTRIVEEVEDLKRELAAAEETAKRKSRIARAWRELVEAQRSAIASLSWAEERDLRLAVGRVRDAIRKLRRLGETVDA